MLENLPKRIPTSVILFLFFFSVYAFTMSGWLQWGGETEKYRVTQSLVERFDFPIRPIATRNEVGYGGRSFSIYELGQSLVQVPFYALGRLAFAFFSAPDVNQIAQLWVGLVNPILTALACVVLYQLSLAFGFPERIAIALACLYGLSTIAWQYSKNFDREPLLTLLILLAFYAAWLYNRRRSTRWLIVAGLLVGYLVFSKFIQAMVIPFFLGYFGLLAHEAGSLTKWDRGRQALAVIKVGLLFLFPTILFLGLQSIYAFTRFGTPFSGIGGSRFNLVDVIFAEVQASHPIQATLALLFSSDRSIFVYSPPVILFLVAWQKWFRRNPKEATLVLGIVLIEFLSTVLRWEWWGGPRWGVRYLVQITPLLILPIGVLDADQRLSRRTWKILAACLFALGLVVQVVGTLTNERDYFDITGLLPSFAGELEFLRYRALDSLVLYLTPGTATLQVNPFAILLAVAGTLLAALIVARLTSSWESKDGNSSIGTATLFAVLAIELGAFVIWVVAPYSRILTSQANTKYLAGNLFQVDRQTCKANRMYILALRGGTDFQKDAALRVKQGLGFQDTGFLSSTDLMQDVELEDGAQIEEDPNVTWTVDSSVKISTPWNRDFTATALSRSLPVRPNTIYMLSGWTKQLNVYGTGDAVVSIYEDDGTFTNKRTIDIRTVDETSGWQPFWGTITTLPTTQRVIIKLALWQTFGTIWISNVHFNQLDSQSILPPNILPICDLKE